MAPSARPRRSARRSRAGAAGPRRFAPSPGCARRPGTPPGSPVDAALPSEQSGVDEIPPQRGVIGVHGLQHAIDLVLAVLAAGCEPARKVDEDGLAPLAPGGDRLETPIAEERRELGRAIKRSASHVIAFRPLHPCDDTRAVPLTSPERINIVEVAPRDGLQAEDRTLSTDVKLELLDRLAESGHTAIEATSFVSAKAVPQLADAERLMKLLKPRAGVRYTALVPNQTGLERALACGVREIAVFASASESYSRKNLNQSRDAAIAGYEPVIARAKAAGVRARRDVLVRGAGPCGRGPDADAMGHLGRG